MEQWNKALLLKSVGMTLEKGKEHEGIMLANSVEEQDGIMLAKLKVPSIPTLAA